MELSDGSLISQSEYDMVKTKEKNKKPFEDLASAFKKFRNETKLESDEDEVGKEVVRIVKQVNIHGHTKTCRKLIEVLCSSDTPNFPFG